MSCPFRRVGESGKGMLEKTQDSLCLGDKFMKLVMKLAYKIVEGELCASVPASIDIQCRRCRTVHHMGTLRTDVVRELDKSTS